MPSPAPTELGVEIALGHPGGVVVVQEVAAVAPLAEPSQPMLAHRGLGPAVPGVALHAWDSPVTASLSPLPPSPAGHRAATPSAGTTGTLGTLAAPPTALPAAPLRGQRPEPGQNPPGCCGRAAREEPQELPQPCPQLTVHPREGQGPSSSLLLHVSLRVKPDLLHTSHQLLHHPCSGKSLLQPGTGRERGREAAPRAGRGAPQRKHSSLKGALRSGGPCSHPGPHQHPKTLLPLLPRQS